MTRQGERADGGRGGELLLGYGVTLLIAALLCGVIVDVGGQLTATLRPSAPMVQGPGGGHMWHTLLGLVVVIAATRGASVVAARLSQPPVMGEIAAGMMLGPSLLGWMWPAGAAWLLPESIAPALGVLAKLGVVLFMFLVGLEFNARTLRQSARAAALIAHASILAPLLLGAALALALYPVHAYAHTSFVAFAAFLGVSMSVTAFPVLARILRDTGMSGGGIGQLAVACAAIDDVTAWCLLALVSALAGGRPEGAVVTWVAALLYVIFALLALRPALRLLVARVERAGALDHDLFGVLLCVVFASAALTDAIGVHALFGAFVVGALIPASSKLAAEAERRLDALVHTLLLPIFFVFTGLRAEIGLVEGAGAWLTVALITAVATLGKFGGTFAAAKLARLSTREASALGVLMNTRGLMELIVLNVGLELGVLSPRLFTMMVLMALITTFATPPLFRWLTDEPTPPTPSPA